MAVKKPTQVTAVPAQDALSHDRNLLLAISRVSQSFQCARTADDFYRAVGREIKSLGGMVTLLTVNQDHSLLTVAYTSYELKLIREIEKLIGASATGYSFSVLPNSIYARKLTSGNAEYVHWTKENVVDALPLAIHPMIDQIIEVFDITQSILAPLRVDNETLGLMAVSGLSLNEDDVPIIDSFAGQIAAGLHNVRLMQKLQNELSARKQVEESLNHNRDLLLALSHTAQTIQRAHTVDDIYHALGNQIKSLGGDVTLLMLGEDRQSLIASYMSYAPGLIRKLEKLTGSSAIGYRIAVSQESIYARDIASNKAEYVQSAKQHFYDAFPKEFRYVAEKIIDILNVEQGILAPLHVEGETLGLMMVTGLALNVGDVPAMESFAGQVAAGLRNARLVQQVETELKERKQAEAALRASEEKIHALFDAIPDMMFMLDCEGRFIDYHAASGESLYVLPEAFLGKNIRDIMPSQMVKVYQEKLDHAIQSGESQLFEYSLEERGGLRYFEAHLVAYQGDRVLCIIRDITRRKIAEEAVKQTERHFKALIEKAPDGITLIGLNGRAQYISPSAKTMFGYDFEDAIAVDPVESIHPDDLALVLGTISDLIQNPSHTPIIQYRNKHRDGSYRWVESTFSNLLEDPSVQAVVINFRDITERKQTQEALTASLAELHALFASMHDAVLVIDRNGDYRKVASTNSDRLYIRPEDIIGKKLIDLFPQDEVERFIKVIQQVLITQQTMQIEYKLEVNGYSPWFEASISPLDADSTIWVARDISERKLAETKLRLQSAALEAAANAIIITDRDGIVQWANSSFHSLTGFAPDEAIGKTTAELMKSGVQDQEFYKDLWDTILSGNIWHNELINRRRDGSHYIEEMTITPLRNSENEISHFIAVKQDITERKRAEEALARSERAYRTLFENMPIGLYRTSIDGRILDANPALANMFGYADVSALLMKNANELYTDPDANKKFKELVSNIDTLSAFESEFSRLDKGTFWAEDFVNIIRDEVGNSLYYEGSLIDITDRKKVENDLRRANESLQLAHSELKQMFSHEQVLARTDGLTGQTNRRYFFELAMREFDASIRYQRPLTIILFDIDGFKQVNDSFGHALGDMMLTQVAQTSAAHVRGVDVLARYGGDEFIILLPQTNAQQAFMTAERIRESVASIQMQADHGSFAVTLSIGIAEVIYKPQDDSIEDAIRRADHALYQAKKNGRNHTIIYDEL